MNRKLLIKIENDSELEKVFTYLKSINEPIYDGWHIGYDRILDYENTKIGFLEDDNEWDWDDDYWEDYNDRTTITCQQFFRELKLERICCND